MNYKKILLLILVCTITSFKAQVLDEYPHDQDFYKGGMVNLYKDAHEFLSINTFNECDKKEIYQPRIIVTKDAAVKIIKDNDTANIAKNKCAYDLSMEILKNLKNWTPAEVKGKKIGAITEFIVYPYDLMSNYSPNYNADNFIIHAEYPGGPKVFEEEFHDNFMALFSDYHINGDVNLEFYINESGRIVNARIYPTIYDRDFNKDFMRALVRLKKVWKPALYSNIPIKERIAFPISFSIKFYQR
ncbi:hypothetical protein [Chryseobacterium sp.]|uniref:hypothetical protein n=1 Tax=Chryseobacterium sp. TaxID=1871047 RepID=UPI0025B7F2BD|nr:hypothetical protein [Chryseobacterium sp.]